MRTMMMEIPIFTSLR